MKQPNDAGFLYFALEYEEFIRIGLLLIFVILIVAVYVYDRVQKKKPILRNYPVIGHFRYLFLYLGDYVRAYFITNDREELPFNRAERNWIHHAANQANNMVGFGSTRNLKPVGSIFFVNAPFAVLNRDMVKAHPITIGEQCKHPYTTNSIFNISGMSYGALSKEAVLALSYGAKQAGIWMNTGEGGCSPYHLESGCDIVAQIGTAKHGYRNEDGSLSHQRLQNIANHPQVKMFEIKLSQGAKPGKGGIVPGIKVTEEIAQIRGIKVGEDSISPNRFPEIENEHQLLDFIHTIREVTGKPTGCKFVLGSYEWLDTLCKTIIQRGLSAAPDFITLDSSDGGTGASPMGLIDYMGLPIQESLPVLVDTLNRYGLRQRIKIIASGKLITAAEVAWALCIGADFVTSARGFLLSLGCIQSMRCHLNTCPTGITTHDKRYTRGLVAEKKSQKVANYARYVVDEVGIIAHSCGVKEPRELSRHHARMVLENGLSKSLAELYPPVPTNPVANGSPTAPSDPLP